MESFLNKIKQRLNAKGIIIGFLVDIIASLIIGIAIGIIFAVYFKFKFYDNHNIELIIKMLTLIIGLFNTIIGGYIAGKISKREEIINASSVGIIGVILGAFFLFSQPIWFNVSGFILTIPCACLGGYLAKKRNRRIEIK